MSKKEQFVNSLESGELKVLDVLNALRSKSLISDFDYFKCLSKSGVEINDDSLCAFNAQTTIIAENHGIVRY